MAALQRQDTLYQEGRLDLAYQAYKQGDFQTHTAAAKAYDVPPKKLKRRLAGIQPRLGSIAKNRLLTLTEEETLLQWILSMDRRGMPPRVTTVRQMASLLVAQHGGTASVGQNWARNFINR